VDEIPSVRDADRKGRVSGRTVNVTVGQGAVDTPAGRKLAISDFVFEVPDLAPKPAPTRVRFGSTVRCRAGGGDPAVGAVARFSAKA